MRNSAAIKTARLRTQEFVVTNQLLIQEQLLEFFQATRRRLVALMIYKLSGYSIREIVEVINNNRRNITEGDHYPYKISDFIQNKFCIGREAANQISALLQESRIVTHHVKQDNNILVSFSIDYEALNLFTVSSRRPVRKDLKHTFLLLAG